MKSLFLRIFLSFWVAQALFIVLAILVTLAFRPRNPSWEALRTTALNDSVSAYEEGGDRQVRQYLMDLENTQHVRVFLFNEQGEEVSRRAAPDWALRIAAGGPRMPREGFVFPAPSVLRDSRASSDGLHRYTLVLGLPPGPRVFFGPRGMPVPGLIIAVVPPGWFAISCRGISPSRSCGCGLPRGNFLPAILRRAPELRPAAVGMKLLA
jgi:hypothetical protein